MSYVFSRCLLVTALGVSACSAGEKSASTAAEAPIAVKLAEAHEEPLPSVYRSSGTVRGRSTAVLTSKAMGAVTAVLVNPGDTVKAGQLLVQLEANDVMASVRRARAGMEQSGESRTEAENAVKAAQANATMAKQSHERSIALLGSRAISQAEFDDTAARMQAAVAQEQMAQARLRGSASRIDQANAELGQAQAYLDYARIVAPFSGRVIERRIDPGNMASPGMPLIVVEQEGKLRVETPVEESRAASVSLGDKVRIEVDAHGQEVSGLVSEIVPAVDVASRAFLVKVDLPESVKGLRPGMFARVLFTVGTSPRLVVPTNAVSVRGAIDRLFVAEGKTLHQRIVTLGETQGSWTEVLSGLRAGERVVAQAPHELQDGAAYTVAP